jgi:hypothetical protein
LQPSNKEGIAVNDVNSEIHRSKELTLLDILHGLMDKGVVVGGDIAISIADIDLIYIDLRLLITSVQSLLHTDRSGSIGFGTDRSYQAEP